MIDNGCRRNRMSTLNIHILKHQKLVSADISRLRQNRDEIHIILAASQGRCTANIKSSVEEVPRFQTGTKPTLKKSLNLKTQGKNEMAWSLIPSGKRRCFKYFSCSEFCP